MKNNNNLSSFIWGLLTGLLFVPVIQELVSLILTWFQALLTKPTKIVMEANKEVAKMQMEEQPVSTNVIGFQYDPIDDYEDDLNDKYKSKRK